MRALTVDEMGWVVGGQSQGGGGSQGGGSGSGGGVAPGPDRDGDGDRDWFDGQHDHLDRNPWDAFGDGINVRTDLRIQNYLHEMAEDVRERFDRNPNNDSMFDGGNGSGNETPTPRP